MKIYWVKSILGSEIHLFSTFEKARDFQLRVSYGTSLGYCIVDELVSCMLSNP